MLLIFTNIGSVHWCIIYQEGYTKLVFFNLICIVSSQSLAHLDTYVGDATYAYKLKREKTSGPPTPSQELNEIVDNVVPVWGESLLYIRN